MNIVYTCQDNYAHLAGVSISSLLENNAEFEIRIYFLDSGLSELSKDKLRNICSTHKNAEIFFFDVAPLINSYSNKMKAFQNNYATYAKLFIELLLPKDIDECLYIDADTLVLGSLDTCFKNKTNFTLYMAYDLVYTKHKINIGLTEDSNYYNAGVIFINLKKWRVVDYSSQIINHLLTGKNYLYGDQDIFNSLFNNDIGVLDYKYNMITQYFFYKQHYVKKMCFNIKKKNFYNKNEINLHKPIILHFTFFPIILRPWYSNSNHPYKNEYLDFVNKNDFKNNFYLKKYELNIRTIFFQKMNNIIFVSSFFSLIVGFILKIKANKQ